MLQILVIPVLKNVKRDGARRYKCFEASDSHPGNAMLWHNQKLRARGKQNHLKCTKENIVVARSEVALVIYRTVWSIISKLQVVKMAPEKKSLLLTYSYQ